MNFKISVVGVLAFLVGCACLGNLESATVSDPRSQGWSQQEIDDWYETSQGSRLIPLAWLLALEAEKEQTPFLAESNLHKFRYETRDVRNWGIRLPRGFAIDVSKDTHYSSKQTKLRWKKTQGDMEPWVGMTCAACHTAEVSYRGTNLTIQGGPTMADFQGFITALDAAIVMTLSDSAKFDRFADAVLIGNLEPAKVTAAKAQSDYEVNRGMLKTALQTRIDWASKLARLVNTDMQYGFGRLDAVGHILNKVALLADSQNATANPADAPVSYPFLWNVPQHDRVQWNGMVRNIPFPRSTFDVGALGRNAGEVIGVFADVNIEDGDPSLFGLSKYPSSVNVKNLLANEAKLRKLKSPAWPDELFGKPDPDLVKKGLKIYNERKCVNCHAVLNRNDLKTPITANLVSLTARKDQAAIGTDIWMACNTFQFETSSGKLKGAKRLSDPPLGSMDKNSAMLPVVIAGTLLDNKEVIVEQGLLGLLGISPSPNLAQPQGAALLTERERKIRRGKDCIDESLTQTDPQKDILVYKARPLNGIWATAPYLHNGSVPNLRQLLLPSARVEQFYVGSKEFDPKNIGFVSDQEPKFPGEYFKFDTNTLGNLNTGHDYGVRPDEVDALLEYLKTL